MSTGEREKEKGNTILLRSVGGLVHFESETQKEADCKNCQKS